MRKDICNIASCALKNDNGKAYELNSVSDTKSSTVYSPKGQSGGTDLQDLYKKRQEWRKRSEDAYQKGGYWRYD